jgi:hypothetical protein
MSKLSFLLLLISSKLCLEGEKKKRRTLEKENEGKWGKREGGRENKREEKGQVRPSFSHSLA